MRSGRAMTLEENAGLLLIELNDPLALVGCAIDRSIRIGGHTFRTDRISVRTRNEVLDRSIRVANPNTVAASRIRGAARLVRCLRVDDINHIMSIHINSTWPAILFPIRDELTIRIEHLNATVGAVGDVHPLLRIHRDPVRHIELAGPRAFLAPRRQELPGFGKLHDPRVGISTVTIGYK